MLETGEYYSLLSCLKDKQIVSEMLHKRLVPKSIVQYDRTAYVYSPGNVRITFDRNISGSPYLKDFMSSYINTFPLLNKGVHVLEVKYDEFVPEFILSQLQIGSLQRDSFSKYSLSRSLFW